MRIILTCLLCFIYVVQYSFAQQDPTFSQRMLNIFSINPGAAGSEEAISTSLTYRAQWTGMDGAPRTLNASGHMPVAPWGFASGVGVSFTQDEFAFDKDVSVSASYAARFSIAAGTLSAGTSLGLISKNLQPEWYIPGNGNTSLPIDDPDIPSGGKSNYVMDLGLGVFYNTETWYAGVSVTHINSPSLSISMDSGNTAISTGKYDLKPNFYVHAGKIMELNNPKWQIIPAIMIHTDLSATQYYGNIRALYNKTVWGGVSYRPNDAVVIMTGVDFISGLSLSYSYDITTSQIAQYSKGSHEIMAGYKIMLKQDRDSKKYKSIRFL